MLEGNDMITVFYGIWQMSVCLFAFLGLMAIWFHIGRKQKDFGQVWLALSILCWSFSGFVEYALGFNEQYQLQLEGWRSILSLLNSLFILLALPWFRHLPTRLEPIIKSKYWPLIVGLPFVFSLLPTINKLIFKTPNVLISELDVYYAVLTLLVLGWVLWESFLKRRLPLLAYLSVLSILITFAAQIFKLTDDNLNQTLISAIFKTTLIMIFFALALSWVKDLTERIMVKSKDLRLTLFRVKKDDNIYANKLTLEGIISNEKRTIDLSVKNFELISLFMDRKINSDEGWLLIRPKADVRSGKTYDINDHNEVRRLVIVILDHLYGKNLWSKTEHEIPLKSILFEMSPQRERKIRLALPTTNLTII